jgi:hypothetical protein
MLKVSFLVVRWKEFIKSLKKVCWWNKKRRVQPLRIIKV